MQMWKLMSEFWRDAGLWESLYNSICQSLDFCFEEAHS